MTKIVMIKTKTGRYFGHLNLDITWDLVIVICDFNNKF